MVRIVITALKRENEVIRRVLKPRKIQYRMQEPGLSTQTSACQGQKRVAAKVDDRCDVKKAAKEGPIKTKGFAKKEEGAKAVKK